MISRPTGLGHASEEEHLEARVCDERWRAAWRRSAWCTAAGGTSSGWSCSNRDGHVISHVHHAKEACEPRMLMIVRSTSVRVPCGVASVARLVPVSVPGTCTPASAAVACQHFLLASFTRTKTAAMTLGQVLERIMARAASHVTGRPRVASAVARGFLVWSLDLALLGLGAPHACGARGHAGTRTRGARGRARENKSRQKLNAPRRARCAACGVASRL